MTPPRKTAGQVAIKDEFNGDTAHLCESIEALLWFDDQNALVPHPLGGHAKALLSAAYVRLKATTPGHLELEAAIEAILPHVWGARSTRRERAIKIIDALAQDPTCSTFLDKA
jgi:hypothetical protein